MAIIKCRECGAQISSSASQCPRCGIKRKDAVSSVAKFFILVFLIIPMGIAIFSTAVTGRRPEPVAQPKTPEELAADRKAQLEIKRAMNGAILLKKSARDPDSFKLEQALIIDKTGSVCYTYRARNGFNGMNIGYAVLNSSGDFKNDEMRGFNTLWKKECDGKLGRDVKSSINWFAL